MAVSAMACCVWTRLCCARVCVRGLVCLIVRVMVRLFAWLVCGVVIVDGTVDDVAIGGGCCVVILVWRGRRCRCGDVVVDVDVSVVVDVAVGVFDVCCRATVVRVVGVVGGVVLLLSLFLMWLLLKPSRRHSRQVPQRSAMRADSRLEIGCPCAYAV